MKADLFEKGLTTKQLGRKVVYLHETESTNRFAVEMYKEGKLLEDTVIFADIQTNGRGRLNRAWHSEGGLAMTAALLMETSPETLGPVTLLAGAAVSKAISSLTGKKFKVKYPNDILFEGKKLGGILSEIKIGETTAVIIGIGVNVGQSSFPKEIADIAISLKQIGTETTREEVSAEILNTLEPMLALFKAEGFAKVRPIWIEENCTLGKEITIKRPGGDIAGKAINIDDAGDLVVETAKGTVKVNSGDFLQKG
jgi:BirA family biotin operon repressor/biotin-[acetyl-CoA-carboxylase] ligase